MYYFDNCFGGAKMPADLTRWMACLRTFSVAASTNVEILAVRGVSGGAFLNAKSRESCCGELFAGSCFAIDAPCA
jgi:hypothetical protein